MAAGGASSASVSSVLIGVTWLTTSTVSPGVPGHQPLPRRLHPDGDRGEALTAGRRGRRVGQPGRDLAGPAPLRLGEGQALPLAEVGLP